MISINLLQPTALIIIADIYVNRPTQTILILRPISLDTSSYLAIYMPCAFLYSLLLISALISHSFAGYQYNNDFSSFKSKYKIF